MLVHFSTHNGVHITVFYVQRSVKVMPVKYGVGLTSPVILSVLVTWFSVISAFFQTCFSSALSGILQVLKGLKSVESLFLS